MYSILPFTFNGQTNLTLIFLFQFVCSKALPVTLHLRALNHLATYTSLPTTFSVLEQWMTNSVIRKACNTLSQSCHTTSIILQTLPLYTLPMKQQSHTAIPMFKNSTERRLETGCIITLLLHDKQPYDNHCHNIVGRHVHLSSRWEHCRNVWEDEGTVRWNMSQTHQEPPQVSSSLVLEAPDNDVFCFSWPVINLWHFDLCKF